MMYNHPDTWHRLMELIARVTSAYLNMQVGAGADVVQLFDSWVGNLGRTISALRPAAYRVDYFGDQAGRAGDSLRHRDRQSARADARGRRRYHRTGLARQPSEAWARLGYDVAVQGNLDPIALFAEVPEIRNRARAILDQAAGRAGHIFNLGHGILPETPVDHAIALVDAVHEMSRRARL